MQDCTISRGSLAGSGLFIADVFKQATTFRQICPEFRKNVEGAARRFTNFVADEFPGVQRFDELRPFMVAQYQQRLRADGLSDNTVRLYLRAVKMADSFVERNYGRTTPALVVEQEIPRPAPKPKLYLSFEQLCACLRRARENYLPSAVLGFALGGFAGMRLTEIIRLTPEKLKGDCVWIDGRTKNRHSPRVIPLCDVALRFARAHGRLYQRSKRGRTSGTQSNGAGFYATETSLSHTMADVLAELHAETGEEEYGLVDPHEAARKTFDNLLYRLGVPADAREGYQGRKLQGMGASHYTDVVPVPGELPKPREEKIQVFRERIIAPLNSKLKSVEF